MVFRTGKTMDTSLRHDREDDDWNLHDMHDRRIGNRLHVQWSAEQFGPWEQASAPRQGCRWHNRGIDHLVDEQLGNLDGPQQTLDHGNRPLHHDREIDDANSVTSA